MTLYKFHVFKIIILLFVFCSYASMNVSALLNSTPVSMNTQLPNNNISISNISATYSITEGETLYIDANYADADGDTGTFADNATQWNVNTSTGIVSWVTTDGDQGIYPWQINVSDGYGSISVYNFTVTVDESLCSALLQDNIIYVYGNYSTNLTCIKNEINNASALEYLGSNEFLLKVPMIVNDTATVLNINNSDTAWLKLQSLNNSNVSYLKAQGTVEISNTKLTSWNNTSGTVAPNSDSIRSYIWINGTSSNANILNSNLSYLGYSEYYDSHSGISFQDTQGNVSNNIITGNYNGLTILSPVWTTTVHNNTISNVTWGLFALNYNSGVINISENNISNYSSGIQVNNVPNITIYHNTLQYGTGSGIYLYNSVGYVDYNTIRNSSNSIVLNPANNSYIRYNTIINSSGEGIAILAASEYNLIEYNYINHTTLEGFDIENSSNNIFRYNNVTGAYYDGYFIWNVQNTTIEHSRMFENGWGYGHGLQAWNSSKIYVQNNEVYDNLKVGMMFTDNGSEYYINNNTIYGNQLGYGIVLYNTSDHILTNNSISEVYDYMLGGYYTSKNNYDWANNITVRDPFDSWSTVKFYANNTSIKFEDTDNTLFNETASETAYWYPAIANLSLNGSINNDVNVTRLNASIIPSSDSLGISVYNWSLSASDNYYKKWNESTSNVSVTSNHIIGDFAPNANIQIKINNTPWNSYLSNASGYINFTYNSGYSEVQFEAQKLGNLSIEFIDPTPENNSINTTGSVFINTSVLNADNGTALLNWNNSLVAWWRFNEGTGGTLVQDFSGNGYNGTWTGNTTSNVTTGRFGNGLDFDGIDDNVSIPSINLGTIHSASLWIDFKDTGDGVIIGRSGAINGYILYIDQTNIYYNPNAVNYVTVTHGGLSPGTFYNLAVVRNGLSVDFYKNGVQLGTTQTLTSNDALTGLVSIGRYGNGLYPTNMTLDEVKLYNRTIGLDEINASYNSGLYRLSNNFTGLSNSLYNYTAYVQNASGYVNQTETRTVTVSQESLDYIPPSPTNLANITGNFWVNHTWQAGSGNVTNSYNVSQNSTWNNTSALTYKNISVGAHNWSNITVYAYNSSGNGSLNSTPVSMNTQVQNNVIMITNTSNKTVTETETVYVDYDYSDADSDTGTFSCNRTDLFTDFSISTGKGNWTTNSSSAGTYYLNFGVSDGYDSISNYTMEVIVNELGNESINVSVYAGSWQPILVNNSMTMAQYGATVGALAVSAWNTTTERWDTHIVGRQSKANWPLIKGQGVDARFLSNKTINMTLDSSYSWNLSVGWNLVGIL